MTIKTLSTSDNLELAKREVVRSALKLAGVILDDETISLSTKDEVKGCFQILIEAEEILNSVIRKVVK